MSVGLAVELRPPELGEAQSVCDLLNALSRDLYGVDVVVPDDVRRTWTTPGFVLQEDARVAVTSGRLAGYAEFEDIGDEHTRYWVDVRVHPSADASEVGKALLETFESRARHRVPLAPAAARVVVYAGGPSEDGELGRLLAVEGYRPIRHSFWMEIALDGPPPAPDWPDAISVRTFVSGADERVVYDLHQDAFQDTWEHFHRPYEQWDHWMIRGGDFDPSLWFLAADGDEVVGIALCGDAETEPDLGFVSILAVRRAWRGRGLGLALLRHAFAAFHRRGKRRVGLGVDAESPTGAVRLYERAGMSVVRRFDIYEKELRAAQAAPGSAPAGN